MTNQIEIVYGNSMKINKGQYEQEAPFYSLKKIMSNGETCIDEIDEFKRLRGIIDPLLYAQYNETKNILAGLRIREKGGKRYPSVTTILSPDKPQVPNLEKYGLRGTEFDRICKHWCEKGELLPIDLSIDISPLKWEDIKCVEFFEKFADRFGDCKCSVPIYHEKHFYSGEIDYLGIYDGLMTLGDFKTGTWKLEQLVAYYKAVTDVKIDQLAIFDLKNADVILFPLKDKKLPEAWDSFMIKRGEFRARFGV